MDQTSENTQGQKPKICKLAIASPLVIILGFLAGVAFAFQEFIPEDLGVVVFLVSLVVGLILGVIACWKIYKSKGALRGYIFSIWGVAAIAVIIIFLILLIFHPRRPGVPVTCGSNLAGLGKAILMYAHYSGEGKYPTPNKWCDLLIKYADVDEKNLVCPGALRCGDKGRCHYAINPNCRPISPEDTVLLFETSGGWNQHGGPELLNHEHHNGEGCNILFNNTHVRFIRTEKLGELKWDDK